jgi:hypothetical protein
MSPKQGSATSRPPVSLPFRRQGKILPCRAVARDHPPGHQPSDLYGRIANGPGSARCLFANLPCRQGKTSEGSRRGSRLDTASNPITTTSRLGGVRMKRAFVFPGQGSQAVGMGRSLAEGRRLAKQDRRREPALGHKIAALRKCFKLTLPSCTTWCHPIGYCCCRRSCALVLRCCRLPSVPPLDRMTEPHRFARDESQLPGSIGRDAKRICRRLLMARIGWIELRDQQIGAHLRYFKK